MGYMTAVELRDMVQLDQALEYHLQYNHYPPLPLSLLPACKAAIKLANSGEWEEMVELPYGVTYHGEDRAPVYVCVEGWHLEAFLGE